MSLQVRCALVLAVPTAMFGWAHSALGAFVERTFFGMWLHELGHASASWACGLMAVPLPWVTYSGEQRSWGLVVLLVGALGLWALALRRAARSEWLAPALGAAVILGLSTLLSLRAANVLIVFAGDAGAMIYGTALLLASLLPDGSRLARGGFRWGYLVIGGAALGDAANTWVLARQDPANLPFGLEGGMPSDASRLVDQYGWAETRLIGSYLWLAALCALVLLAVSAWRWRQALALEK